ncbi:hypothetical protein MF271_00775 (plasmid) [Deinococcus sp. KNUC1210]|uniref:hypothetical protein n=1 Tax=Deinococcus sp. KNUC1210 TaxID=2917691 RepID=UPI001EEF9583|nr:hypothetical protein [Deinococcus sp. KNUC1210]ULH14046.1 hypothetical protein MF271_00775 [Deinococcus sp. KNUC1210]
MPQFARNGNRGFALGCLVSKTGSQEFTLGNVIKPFISSEAVQPGILLDAHSPLDAATPQEANHSAPMNS